MKFIKKLICKIFHIKACQCPDEVDEHIEFFTKTPEPDVPVHTESVSHCSGHTRYRVNCKLCNDAIR